MKEKTKTAKKSTKKTMTEEQLAELESAENAFVAYREDVATMKGNVREAERDTREAQTNLKKEKNHLAKAEKDVAFSKKHLAKLKTKYKGWARPKPAPLPVQSDVVGAGDHGGDSYAVPE